MSGKKWYVRGMQCFVVMLPPDSTVTDQAIEQHFADRFFPISPGVWAVAGMQQTAADVCEVLGIGGAKEDENSTGVVVKISEYYGFMDKALWLRLDAWGKER